MSRNDLVRPVQKARTQTLRSWLAERNLKARAGIVPSEFGDGYLVTADHVIDDPREPRITPTGILDSRGEMLCRVTLPIKVPMGFHLPGKREVQEWVDEILPEDYLGVSDCGVGVGFVHPDDVSEPEIDVQELVNAALEHCEGDPECARKLLAEHGFEVEFDIVAKPPAEDA